MTKALSNTPLWPYIGVVSCLLFATLLSPRLWRHVEDDPFVSEPDRLATAAIGTPSQPHESMQPLPSLDEFQASRQVARIFPPVTERIEFDPSLDHLPSLPAPETNLEPSRVTIAPPLMPPTT